MREMVQAMIVFGVIAIITGSLLIYEAFRDLLNWKSIALFIAGGASIVAAVKYTVGKSAYGYRGLGDLFVFIFFGVVSVMGSYFAMSGVLPWICVLPAVAIGFLSSGVLNMKNIRDIEVINEKVRTNLNKEKAEEDADAHRAEYDTMTAKLNDVRQKKIDLLKNASLPLPGLSVENGELTYNGHRWDSMSGSEQLKVSTAIVRKLNPNCGFVLIDKLEQMDTETLQDFGTWLEQEGLQAIATRVSTGGECSIIIEDGYVKGEVPQKKEWKAGEF